MVNLLHIEPILVIFTFHADNLFHHAILTHLHSFMEKCFVHACDQLEQFLLILCVYFLAVLDLHWFAWEASSRGKQRGATRGCRVQTPHRLASLAAERRPEGAWASAVVARGRTGLAAEGAACAISLDQGSNLSPLSWQVDSYPLRPQGGSKNA